MSLTDTIELVQQKNESALAQQVATPRQDIDASELMQLKHFSGWCRARGVRAFPCRPTTIASFIRAEHGFGVPDDKILSALRAIEKMHDEANEPSPTATAVVRAELGRILKIDAPRSWPKADRPLFLSLPPEVQAIVARRAEQDSLALRRLQNKVADLAKKGNLQCQPENKSTVAFTDSPTTQPSS